VSPLTPEEELLVATAETLRNDRANAIVSYYNNRMSYFEMIELDGDGTDEEDIQARFKAWQDLIKEHHEVLQELYGYVTGSYLPDDEGVIETGEWWSNADSSAQTATMFYRDAESARSGNFLYKFNAQSAPHQRSSYILWNQTHSVLGSVDDRSWRNANDSFTYTDTYNPFSTGSSFRMKEPLESYGATSNLVWGRVVHNGNYHYRHDYINDTSYSGTADQGFTNLVISSKTNPINANSIWCSTWEKFRYTFWGGLSPASRPSFDVSATGGSWFRIDGIVSGDWAIGSWYMMWDGSRGWVFHVNNVTVTEVEQGSDPPGYTYTYYTTIYYDSLIGHPSGIQTTNYNCTINPEISQAYKLSFQGNGIDSIWTEVYNTYGSSFTNRLDLISSQVEDVITALGDITSYDYTIINDDTGMTDPGKQDAQDLIDDLTTWLSEFKALVGDTGSGATYVTRDSKWSNTDLDELQDKLRELINFSGYYDSYTTSLISDYRDTVYNLLGDYVKDTVESWNPPNVNAAQHNNKGALSGGFYYWRFTYIDERVNVEEGVLTIQQNSYRTYNRKLDLIDRIENLLSEIVFDSEYDLIPEGFDTSDNEEAVINVDWDDTKAASSYRVERKEGVSGGWVVLDTDYGYHDPGWTPDFTENPESVYNDSAYVRGYQEFGLNIVDSEDSTGLADDFTIYDFYMNIDGTGNQLANIKGMDAQSWEALAKKINDDYDTILECEVVSNDIRITTLIRGSGGSVELTAGPTNDLFTALSTTLDSEVVGQDLLEQGKVYYYRVRVNNGYNTDFGSDGNEDDKDWDSQSEWQTVNYDNDRRINGDAGKITWDPVSYIIASGVEDGLTGSDAHIRIEWNTLPNVNYYKVYRATDEDAGYVYMDDSAINWYEDTSAIPGVIYWYRIKGVGTSDYQLYDNLGNFSGPIETILSTARTSGKRLWQPITLEASRDDFEKVTLSWTSLSGANGYTVWISKAEAGPYMYVPEDNVKKKIVTSLTYEDEYAARQFFSQSFSTLTDGIADTEYDTNRRYYFQVIVTNPNTFEDDVNEYYITSPTGGIWTAQQIADDINNAIDNATCDLYQKEMPNTGEISYEIRIKSSLQGVRASIGVLNANPDRERDLISLLGGMGKPVEGGGAYPVVEYYYKVKGVETAASGEILRESEFSNTSKGYRPLPSFGT
jgi:hypothetical protein